MFYSFYSSSGSAVSRSSKSSIISISSSISKSSSVNSGGVYCFGSSTCFGAQAKNISDNINSISMDGIYFDLSTKEMDGVDEIITNDLSIDDSKSFDYKSKR